jgi:hypothetical protein
MLNEILLLLDAKPAGLGNHARDGAIEGKKKDTQDMRFTSINSNTEKNRSFCSLF